MKPNPRSARLSRLVVALLAVLLAVLLAGRMPAASACPFCSAVSLTFSQEIAQSQAAVIARLVEPPPASALSPTADGPLPKGKFEVVEVLKGGDLVVNPTKNKQLTNMRASGTDEAVRLTPPRKFSLEEALDYISSNEYVEVTPLNIRLRKK